MSSAHEGGVRWPASAHDESTWVWKSGGLVNAVGVSDQSLTIALALSVETARKVAGGVQRGQRLDQAVGGGGTVHAWNDVVSLRHTTADPTLVVTHYEDGKRRRLTLQSDEGAPTAAIFDEITARLRGQAELREDARARRTAVSKSISTGLGLIVMLGIIAFATAGIGDDYRGRRSWLVMPVRDVVQGLGTGGLLLVAIAIAGVTAAVVAAQAKRPPEARILKIRAGDRRTR